ncbi:MAG: hypothetical protein GY853_00880 [PVC group bacterium]|nr:hypothetical protein [PVC group bacterium]
MNKNKKLADGNYRKVMITLVQEQEQFLDKLRMEIAKKSNTRMSRTEIIRALVDYLATLKLNLSGIKDEKDLKKRIIESIRK